MSKYIHQCFPPKFKKYFKKLYFKKRKTSLCYFRPLYSKIRDQVRLIEAQMLAWKTVDS